MALSETQRQKWLSEDFHRIVLMDLGYHDGTSVSTLHFSSYPYIMPQGDTAWDSGIDSEGAKENLIYDDIIYNIPNITSRIDSSSSVGSIELINSDGEYDYLLRDVTIVGHPIKLYIGDTAWPRENFILILDGIVSAVSSSSPEKINLSVRDRKEALNIPLQSDLITMEYWSELMDRIADIDFQGRITTNLNPFTQKSYSRALANLPESTENTHVPICLGKCFNIEPILIDSFNHIYLIHDGDGQGIFSVDEVRSNGVPLGTDKGNRKFTVTNVIGSFIVGETIIDNDDSTINGVIFAVNDVVPDNTLLETGTLDSLLETISGEPLTETSTPTGDTQIISYTINDIDFDFSSSSGTFIGSISGATATAGTPEILVTQYEVDLTIGLIRLLDHSNGTQITCDVTGQNGASTLRSISAPDLIEYSAADIIEWILLEKAGIDPADICYNTFNPVGIDPFLNTDALGIYYTDETTVLNAITSIINSVGGFTRYSSDICKLQLVRLEDPVDKTVDLILGPDDIIYNGISIASIEEPKKSITLGYKKNWKTQDEGSLAGSIVEADSSDYNIALLNSYKDEYSTKFATTNISEIEYPLAEDVDIIETFLYDGDKAQNELDRRIILRKQRRHIIRIRSIATSFTYTIGDIVFIEHPRFGLENGKKAMIIGIEESPTTKRVTLDVWL